MPSPQINQALKEIQKLTQENNDLLEIIQGLKISLHKANEKISDLTKPKLQNHKKQAEEAMKRYTDKLRKESEQYAKQKQSKRK